jgi:hypothetical protein
VSRYRRRFRAVLIAVLASAFAVAFAGADSVVATASAASPDLLDVVQVGTGEAPLTNAATATFVVPLLGTGGTGTPIPLPTAAAGSQHPFGISGSATSEGALALSSDGNFLTLAGYGATPGTTGPGGGTINGTTSATVPRVVARIDGAGNVDTSTALSDAFSASNVRGAVSSDGQHFWVTGDGGSTTSGTVKNASISYAASLGATTSTGLTSSPKQARAVTIAGGNLYMSTSKSPGPGVFQVGSGLPTTNPQSVTSIGAEADPYGFVLLKLNPASPGPDTLYAADGTTGGIFKYSLVGSSWVAEGSVAGPPLGSLTGKVEGSSVQLYATTNDGLDVLAFTDSSGAGATISSGSFATIATAPLNTVYRGIAFAPNGQVPPPPPTPAPTVTLSENALGATINDSFNPTLEATVADESFAAEELKVTATSSDQTVIPDANIALSGSGASRTLSLTPVGVGETTITVTATTPDGVSGHAQFEYGASAAAPDATSIYLYGSADASSAIDVGDGYFLVADDENSTLRLYSGAHSGFPVKSWNFDAQMGNPAEIDLEWSARHGDTIVWGGSQSNSKTGDARPSASIIFATSVSGSGASTELSFAGSYAGLRNDLLAWDASNGNAFGFAAAAEDGVQPKQEGGYNIEGMEFAPGSSTTAYLGFRAPIVPPTNRKMALVVPVTNLLELATGAASHATFGTPMEWNLGGQGVREIRKNADDQYLGIAGDAGEGGSQHLYTWDGNPADQPVATGTVLPALESIEGAWESISSMPDPLTDGATIPMIEDNGDTVWYGGSTTAKDLPLGMEKDWADSFALALPPQTLSFTSTPPAPAYAGSTYAASTSGGPSGEPVVLSIDPASDSGACSISGSVVSLLGPGSCIVDADQAGNFQYAAAERISQTIDVTAAPAPTVIPVISGTLGTGGWYVSNVTVSWEVSSSVPASNCAPTTLSSDTGGTVVSCTSTSVGGSTTKNVTIKLDKTKPIVSFSGNAGSYAVTQSVTIACTASDSLPGSGIASSTCPSVSAPAWSLGLGSHTLSASATDNAGNTNTASTSFTVTVTPTSLCTLTSQFVQGSAKYQQLNALQRLVVNALVTGGCNLLTQIAPHLSQSQAAVLIAAYKQAIQALAGGGWLTQAQVGVLTTFAGSL